METKLIAADIATAAGVTTIITSSKDPTNIFKIIEYDMQLKSGSNTPLNVPHSGRSSPEPSVLVTPTPTTLPLSHESSESVTPTPSTANFASNPSPSPILVRPPHTAFVPSVAPLRDLKSWTRDTLFPSGSVIIDSGAHTVLAKRDSGGRLLAAGVIGIRGAFASGQAVRIVVRKRQATQLDPSEAAKAPQTSSGAEPDGAASTSSGSGAQAAAYAETEPNTPEIFATASLSSSISSISSALEQLAPIDDDMTPSTALKPLPEDDTVVIERALGMDVTEWELEEVGRGLANYNSAQIDRVKGLKRYRLRAPLPQSCADRGLSYTVHTLPNSWVMQTRNTL